MDSAGILGSIKEKALDATHFELLNQAYQRQVQRSDQLKNNNEALKEGNELLQHKARELQDGNSPLKGSCPRAQKKA